MDKFKIEEGTKFYPILSSLNDKTGILPLKERTHTKRCKELMYDYYPN